MPGGQCLIEKRAGSGGGWEQGRTAFEEEETWKGRNLQKGTFEEYFCVDGVLGKWLEQGEMRWEGLLGAKMKGPCTVC